MPSVATDKRTDIFQGFIDDQVRLRRRAANHPAGYVNNQLLQRAARKGFVRWSFCWPLSFMTIRNSFDTLSGAAARGVATSVTGAGLLPPGLKVTVISRGSFEPSRINV